MKNEEFIIKYCQILDNSHGQRPDILWFSTWMASKAPYFDFAKNYEAFWTTKTLPKILSVGKKIRLASRLGVTLFSLILKSIVLKWLYRNELRALRHLTKVCLVRSFLFSSSKNAKDPFWGDLIPALEAQPTPLLILFDPNFSIFKCHQTYIPSKNNFPYYVFLSPGKLLKHYFQLLRESLQEIHYTGGSHSENQDISYLLSQNYQQEILSSVTLATLAFYNCFAHLFSRFEVQKLYIPFENNPWEKMSYLARKNLRQDFKIIGFQHATIQQGAVNYFLSAYEIQNRLFPDFILCTGNTTLSLLQSYPFYQNLQLERGCALRYSSLQEPPSTAIAKQHIGFQKLLVALDGTLDCVDLVNLILNFLESSPDLQLEVRIKEHPNLSLAKFHPEIMRNPLFSRAALKLSHSSLAEDLAWSDALIYSGTTVSFEALRLGKPVIHYNHSAFNYDPLFQFTENKWSVESAQDLRQAWKQLQSLSSDERQRRAIAGKSFVESYFYPCTRESIERFLHI